MGSEVEQLARELKALQSRRGLQSPRRAGSAGVLITQALSLEQYPAGDERRNALIGGLLQHSSTLPPDLSYVFQEACAFNADGRPNLGERLDHAAGRIGFVGRTAWRRLDDANQRVAASLAAVLTKPRSEPPRDWVLTSLHSVADLTEERPVFRSHHTVRVVSPFLTEIVERISFPGAERYADPEFAVRGDCQLTTVERPFQVSWVLKMKLTRKFGCGELVAYSLAVRAPSRRLLHPMSVMLPERECRVFSTEVNFGRPSVARRVWRLDGVPGPVAELDAPSGTLLDPEQEPILRASFDNMVRGRVYGLRWEWADSVHAAEA